MMMSRETEGRPIKWKNKNKNAKPALSKWSKFNVVRVNYPGTKDKQRRNGTSHSWSPDTVKRSASKLTSSQLFKNENFYNQVKTWLVDR